MRFRPLYIPAGQALQRSEVTGKHWVSRSAFFGDSWPMELRDGAAPVEVYDPRDKAATVVVKHHGVAWIVHVCCGPPAPEPAALFLVDDDEQPIVYDPNAWPCMSEHPEHRGLLCRLGPHAHHDRHAAMFSNGARLEWWA